LSAKAALIVTLSRTLNVHGPVPAQPPPLQPTNSDAPVGVAVRVIGVSYATVAVHADGHARPSAAGIAATVPVPLPTIAVVTVNITGANAAVTDVAAARVSVQVGCEPVQAPVQPVNTLPALAAAVSVTWVPSAKSAWHVAPHAMPAGADVIVPAPFLVTVKVTGCAGGPSMAASTAASIGGSTMPSMPASGAGGASAMGGVI
jgi:hypothetical protein